MKKFLEHVTQEEMNALIQVAPTPKDWEKIESLSRIFTVGLDEIGLPDPPENYSKETENEIIDLYENWSTGDIELYRKYDKAFTDDFYELSEGTISLEEFEFYSNEVAKVVHHFKFKWNRPRPERLAPYYGIPLKKNVTITGTTPAYPSGHSAQSRFIALYASQKDPSRAVSYMKLAEDVGTSRLVGGVHYPSDHESGKILAEMLFGALKS